MFCSLCGRKSDGEFCEYHQLAYNNLKERYEEWKESTGLSWIEYLNEVINNSFTGVWSREVALKLVRGYVNEGGDK